VAKSSNKEMHKEKRPAETGQSSPWLYQPALDLIVGCGAWSAPLLLLTYPLAQSSALTLAVAFYALALVFNYPHYMATIYRAYHRREDFAKYRIFTVHITLLVVLTAVIAHARPHLLPWIFTLYVLWSPWHYSGQNYGLLMMFARRNGAQPTAAERNALYSAFLISFVVLLITFQTGPSNDPLVLSLGLPADFGAAIRVAGALAFAGLGGFALWRFAARAGLRAMIAPITLLTTQALWFVVPTLLEVGYGLRVPQTRYSTGVLAVMHSAQYIWVTSYYAKREALAESGGAGWHPWKYFGALTAGGIALFVPGPWLVSYAFHYDFTASFLIFTALVNIHHFILDGAIWKLRDGRIASLLLGGAEHEAEKPAAMAGAMRWLGGASAGARAFRIALVVVLLLWAGVDELRYFLGAPGNGLLNLAQAARLNPYDSAVQMRIARQQSASGNWDASLAALKNASLLRASGAAPGLALARALVQQQRYGEALEQYNRLVAANAADADALTDLGILQSQMGRAPEAIKSWQQAAQAQPSRALLHLYIAEALRQQGDHQAAANEYDRYLQLVVEDPEQRQGAKEMAAILLNAAATNVKVGRTQLALSQYELAARLAQQAGESSLEAAAKDSAAQLKGD